MSNDDEKHRIVKVKNLMPMLVVCACGAKFTGHQALDLHKLHKNVQARNLEGPLERRNVFDQDDKDEDQEDMW